VGAVQQPVAVRRVQVRHHRLAQRARVPGDGRADLEDLHGVVGPEDVVDDDDVLPVQHADPGRLPGAVGQRVRPEERPGPERVVLQHRASELEERHAELVLPGLRVLLDQPLGLQRAQQPVHGALRQRHPLGQLGDAQSRGVAAELPQQADRSRHRLDHGEKPRPPFSMVERNSRS
jgi:hypothetical protein